MTFKEYLEKNEKEIQNMHFENMDEFKKFLDKEKIDYSDEELQPVHSYIEQPNASGDGELSDDDLDAVAGGGLWDWCKSAASTVKGWFSGGSNTSTNTTTNTTANTTDNSSRVNTNKEVTIGGDLSGDVTFN